MHALTPCLKVLLLAAALIGVLYAYGSYSLRQVPEEASFMEPAVRRRAVRLFETGHALPARGTIVWFEHPDYPGRMLISRVVGLPGDRIAIRGGRLVRDGERVSEEYAPRRLDGEELEEIVVPAGHFYALNDARTDPGSPALDSRRLGPRPFASIVGRIGDRAAEEAARKTAVRGVRGGVR